MKPTRWTRRRLLQTASAAASALTLRAAGARAETRRNLVIFYTPNGFARAHLRAEQGATGLLLQGSLAPLAAHAQHVNVITGLCNKSTDVHTGATQLCRLLTCTKGGEPTSTYGASVDQIVAAHVGTPAYNLAVAWPPVSPWQQRLSFREGGLAVANVWDPVAAWDAAFPDAPPWLNGEAQRELMILDYLERDALQTAPVQHLPSKEQTRFQAHRQAWAKQGGLWMNRTNACKAPPFTAKDLAALPAALSPDTFAAHGRAKMDLIVAALACHVRTACTLLWQGAGPGAFNPITGKSDHYEISQRADLEALETRGRIDGWYATQFAYLLQKLKDHKLLDTTLVVWCSEVAEGQHHNNMTFVTAGGAGLGVAQGKIIALPFAGREDGLRETARIEGNRAVADLWLTVLHACGLSARRSFGDDEHAGGVIKELLPT